MTESAKKIFIPIPTTSIFEIETDLNRETAIERLKERVGKPCLMEFFPSNWFSGKVHATGFKIWEVIWYNPTYSPIFYGSFHVTEKGLIVRVKTSNHWATAAALIGWFVCGAVLITAVRAILEGDYEAAAVFAAGTVGVSALSLFMRWSYEDTIRDGLSKLVSILQAKKHGRPLPGRLRQEERRGGRCIIQI